MRCPKCKRGRLRMQVNVFVDCDGDCHSLNKKGIRKKNVKIQGVGWDLASFYCPKCGYILRHEGKHS